MPAMSGDWYLQKVSFDGCGDFFDDKINNFIERESAMIF
jgi:hypothetical protein